MGLDLRVKFRVGVRFRVRWGLGVEVIIRFMVRLGLDFRVKFGAG